MPIVQAWECPQTKKLFKEKSEYIKHLKAKARNNLDDLYERKRLATKEEFFENMRKTCASFKEVEDFVKANWKHFYMNGVDQDQYAPPHRRNKKISIPKLERFELIMQPSLEYCSNTHGAPMGKKTNWTRREPGVPTGYSGYRGHFIMETSSALPFFPSKAFEGIGFCSNGNGSAYSDEKTTRDSKGCCRSSYRSFITMWLDDWTEMGKREMIQKMLNEDQNAEDFM